jgi:DNA primase
MIIRHGEKVMCYIEDENGQEVPLSVAEYISYSLRDDEITLQTPIHKMLLEEAVEKAHTPNFCARQYFLNHPNEAIRSLALQLGPESVELSKLFDAPVHEDKKASQPEGMEGDERELRLDETIPSLIASYKLSIVQQSLQDIIEQMKQPGVRANKEQYRQLLNEFSQKSQLAKELAKECGERVVIK